MCRPLRGSRSNPRKPLRAGNLAALEVLWPYPISSRILQREERGEIDRAIEYHADFVALWQDGDSLFQAEVEDVTARMARLVGERGR